MSEADRYGMPGLMDLLNGKLGPSQSSLALGMDLNSLGLDVLR